MGANNHLTTEPDDVPLETKRLRLKRDLSQLGSVRNCRAGLAHEGSVVFETYDDEMSPEVLSVLADHEAVVPGS